MSATLIVSVVLGGLTSIHGSDLVIPLDTQPANTFAMYPLGGLCANGEEAYFGFIQGPNNAEQDKFFLEIAGGGACFNSSSCDDSGFSAWMGTSGFLANILRLDENTRRVVRSGAPLPMTLVASLRPGWMPSNAQHPLFGRAGIYLPTCTGDFMLGRHTVTYEGDEVTHHGGMNLDRLLTALQRQRSTITDFAIYGGAGGGVTASMWMSRVADLWPMTTVSTFVDSGFLILPGDSFTEFLYNAAPWSVGPGGENEGKLQGVTLPAWNWIERDAIVRQLIEYNGRLRIAYVACDEDAVVSSELNRMVEHSSFVGEVEQMWGFLSNLKKCAPADTAFSYINKCSSSHISRSGFPVGVDIKDEITSQSFSANFLMGSPVDSDNPEKRHFWTESHQGADGGVCPPTPAPTPAPPTPAPSPTTPGTVPAPVPSDEMSGSSGSSTAHPWFVVMIVLSWRS